MVSYIISVLLCLMFVYLLMLYLVYKLHIRVTIKRNVVCSRRQIMDKVKTNCTYPELQGIFSQQNDKSHTTKQNVDFEGYFKIE